jgi:SAM-dependent methyltransferase
VQKQLYNLIGQGMVIKRNLQTTHQNDYVKILADEYFSKPAQALFRSYDLRSYDSVKMNIRQPVLDLGCGNGAFGSVFSQVYELKGLNLGLDLDFKSVQFASRRGLYDSLCSADVRALPINSGSIGLVLSNSVLCCIHPGHELALVEVARILVPGGQFVMTVPTPEFTDNLVPKRLFDRLGLHRLSVWYSNGMNKRNGHRKLQSFEVWKKELEQVGFTVEDHLCYFANSEAFWWSLTAMRPFQLCALFRYFPKIVQRIASLLTELLLRYVASLNPSDCKNCGFLLIVATKN